MPGPALSVPGRVFCWRQGVPQCPRPQPRLPARDPAGPWRHAALAVRRDLRGAVPHRATSTDSAEQPRRASRTRTRATSIRASPTRPSRCSSSAWRALEGAEAARATATGMAAVTAALMGQRASGDHVVAAKALFGSAATWSRNCCRASASPRRWSTAATRRSGRAAVRPNTKAFFLETPDQPDAGGDRHRGGRGDRARGRREAGGRQRLRDAALQSPLELGADCVVYSATKHIDGQGRCLGGVDPGVGEIHRGPFHTFCARPGRRSPRSTPG